MAKDEEVLTDRQRHELATLEAATAQEDPDLDAWLRAEPGSRRRPQTGTLRQRLALGAALTLIGATVVVLTFTHWLWAAALGTALEAAGLWLAVPIVGQVLARRAAALRRRNTAPAPPEPPA